MQKIKLVVTPHWDLRSWSLQPSLVPQPNHTPAAPLSTNHPLSCPSPGTLVSPLPRWRSLCCPALRCAARRCLALLQCYRLWERVKGEPRWSPQWAQLAMAAADNTALCLEHYMDGIARYRLTGVGFSFGAFWW